MTRDLDQWCVCLYEPGRRKETVFVADTKEEAREFACECRAVCDRRCTFRVLQRNVFYEALEGFETLKMTRTTITVLNDRRDANWLARSMSRDLGIQAWVETERLDRHKVVTDATVNNGLIVMMGYCRGFLSASGIEQTTEIKTEERETR